MDLWAHFVPDRQLQLTATTNRDDISSRNILPTPNVSSENIVDAEGLCEHAKAQLYKER